MSLWSCALCLTCGESPWPEAALRHHWTECPGMQEEES